MWAVTAIAGSTPSVVTLNSSTNPSMLGQGVTFTVTVSPSAATGRVVLYDGAMVLGTVTLSGGQALFFTTQLPSGPRSLRAYYGGDSNYVASASVSLIQKVKTLAENGFQASMNYPTSGYPSSVAVGDFNGDGKADLAVTGQTGISVLLGSGDGNFGKAVTYSGGSYPIGVVTADFNGDGKPDLAVANGANDGVSMLLGNGDGTFQPASIVLSGAVPRSGIVASDFNGDGNVDLAVINGAVSVLLGTGDGTFKPPITYLATNQAFSLTVADVNSDGTPDLVVITNGSNGVSVILGKSDGTFTAPITTSWPTSGFDSPYVVTTGDFNGDAKVDLAIGFSTGGLSVLLGKGDGTFQLAGFNIAPSGIDRPTSIAIGDFNGDDNADLVFVSFGGFGLVFFFFGGGVGCFCFAASSSVGGDFPQAMAAGDFNDDGREDLAVAHGWNPPNSVSILIGTAPSSDLIVTKSHSKSLTQGQVGAIYSITVSNGGAVATSGTVSITDNLPSGLTATAISGTGWKCDIAALTCTRSDSLAPSASYPVVIVTVNVAVNAPATVTNSATVSGGGESNLANDIASDPTFIVAVAGSQTITFGPLSTRALGSPPFNISATATSGLPVNFISTTPSVCTLASATVALIAVGACSITATQGGNASYAAAAPVTQTFAVKYAQTIMFAMLNSVTLASPPFSVTAAASSGLPVNFASTTQAICTVSGNLVTIAAAGVCSITATQSGDASYAAADPVSQSFTIVGPIISPGGVVPVFSSVSTIEPGSWISIYGTNLVSASAVWDGNFQGAASLGGVSVMIDGKPAFISSVTKGTPPNADQINAEAPDDVVIGPVPVVVTTPLGSATSTVTLASFAPSFSLLDSKHVAGIILTPDGTGAYGNGTYDIVGPVGAFPYPTRPVKAGENLILFGVGFGATDPPVPAGSLFTGGAPALNKITITIGGVAAPVSFAGISYTGQYQFNLVMPSTLSGDQPITATVGGVQTPTNLVVTVQ